MLCIGYPTRQQLDRPKPPRHKVSDLVHENGYRMDKSRDMGRMLSQQQGKEGPELTDWVNRFCKRKWNSEFSREMGRSCTEMVKDWLER